MAADDFLDDPRKLFFLATGLGLLGGAPNSRKNFAADLAHGGLLGINAYSQAQEAQRKQQHEEVGLLSQSWKMLKDADARARTNALFTGEPYKPNPLLGEHERRMARLLRLPYGNDAEDSPVQPRAQQGGTQYLAPTEGAQGVPGMSSQATAPQAGAPRPMDGGARPSQPSFPEILRAAGIDPRMAVAWASTPEGERALYKQLADVYGPKMANGVMMQLQPNGQTRFLGGVVGNDALPVATGPNGLQVQPIGGLMEARAAQKRAEAEATEQGKAPYSFQSFPVGPGGAQQVMSVEEMRRREQGARPQAPQLPQDYPTQIPPHVQAQRDGQRMQILLQERAALAREGRTDPALEREIELSQGGATFGGQRGMTGPNPLAVKSTESLNDDFIKNSFRPVMDMAKSADVIMGRVETLRRSGMLDGTGWGAGAKAYAANVLGAMGVKDAAKYAADAQTFQKSVFDANWELLNQAKGIQTEGDAQRALKTFVQLQNTPRANKFILDFTAATSRLAKEKAAFFGSEVQKRKGGGDLSAIEAEWQQRAPSLWDMPELKGRWGDAQGGLVEVAPNTVRLPSGQTMKFPSETALRAFKKQAGLD